MVPQCHHLGAADHRQGADSGLKHDLIADDRALRALIPQTLILRSGGSPHAERRRAVSKLQRLGLRRSGFRPLATGVRLLSEAGRLHRRHSGKPPPCGRSLTKSAVKRVFFGNLLWKTRGAMDLLVGHRLAKGGRSALICKPAIRSTAGR